MRELTFDGLSPDGSRLVLAGKDGQKYTVVIDERLEAAVRRDRARMSQVEIETSGVLRPREIQARIRAGATAEDVAAASGLPIEHIRRFEGPVLTERAWVAQQAQATEVRRPGGDIELGDLVAERLHANGVDPADIQWDAWRRDDGLWVVIATFPVPPNTHMATWTYDSGARTMTVADDNARSLSAIDVEEPLRLVAARPLLAPVVTLDDREDDAEVAPVAVLARVRDHGAGSAQAEDLEDAEDLEEAEDLEGVAGVDPEAEPGGAGSAEAHAFPVDEGLAPDEEPAWPEDEDVLADEAEPWSGPADGDGSEEPGDTEDEEPEEPDEEPDGSESATTPDGPTSDAQDVPLFETPAAPAPHRPTGKPSVPSFDDILFGPGPASS